MEDRVRQLFGSSIETTISAADTLAGVIAKAAQRLVQCLLNDKKILLCGNGASAANCLHFSNALINHFEVERPPLPVIALNTDNAIITALADEQGGYADIFAVNRQFLFVRARGLTKRQPQFTGN
mgnify:CR=1 FL=1